MKKAVLAALLFHFVSVTVFSQDVGKTGVFAQIAAGGGIQSVLNLTNRGTTAYSGTLSLFAMANNASVPWNPVINGTTVTNGQWPLSIAAGTTQTLTITATSLQVGFGSIAPVAPSTTDLTSIVEGTLTYYFGSEQSPSDSVGVVPTSAILWTAIPFDSFSNIALALANPSSVPVDVQLSVYSASTPVALLSPAVVLTLPPNGHVAEYLREIFTNVSGSLAGRVEILADAPLYGVALTQAGNQFSSLSFASAIKLFNFTMSFQGETMTGIMAARINGGLLDFAMMQMTPTQTSAGYIAATKNGNNMYAISYNPDMNQLVLYYLPSFGNSSFSQQTFSGTVQFWNVSPLSYLGEGTLDVTSIN